jgi:phosphoglycolate phosphatase-like HAD superfamily hydrolase
VRKGTDILSQIEADFANDPDGRERALQVIVEEEMKGCEKMELRPDMHDVIAQLCAKSVRLAVSTRNCQMAYDRFIDMCDLHKETFHPVLSRESLGTINKPDPQVALHILQRWEIAAPDSVWFVGDSMDDIRCGKGAGCMTCLVGPVEKRASLAHHDHMIDMHVESLSEFYERISHWL